MRYALKPLARQAMLITGASSGIGLVTARRAAAAGARVMLVARDADALAAAAAEIEAAGGIARFAVADVGDADSLRAAAAEAVRHFGGIDTWVNDAGVAIYAKLVDTPLDEHERLFRTNYFGVVNGTTVALEHLRARGGAIVTVASIAAELPSPALGAYSASKHAVKAYIEVLRGELRADRVPVSLTLVKPAGIDTPIGRHAANHRPGEALIPPPAYHPDLVAQVILDAAVRPRRAITVGGVGRLEVLIGTHFPRLIEALTGPILAQASDPARAKTPGDNLFAPSGHDAARSGFEHARRVSLYTAAARRPGLTALGATAVAAASGLWLLARRRRGGAGAKR